MSAAPLHQIGFDIPKNLAELDQWLVWRYDTGNKTPYKAHNRKAGANRPSEWGPLQNALQLLEKHRGCYEGLAFRFDRSEGIVGIDIDAGLDGDNLMGWAQPIIERFSNTYCEVSPSGTGVKLFVRGFVDFEGDKKSWNIPNAPKIRGKGPRIEVFAHDVFFTVTGRRFRGAPLEIEEEQFALDWLLAQMPQSARRAPLVFDPGKRIPKGQQHDHLVSLAASMRERGCELSAIFEALMGFNATSLEEPGPEQNIRKIAHWAAALSPGQAWRHLEDQKPKTDNPPAAPAKRTEPPSLLPYPHTDSGNAERLYALHGGEFLYSHPAKTFLIYDGTRWAPDERGLVRRMATDTARELYRQAASLPNESEAEKAQRKAAEQHARKSESSASIRNALTEAACLHGVAVLPQEFDTDPFLLNCENGTLDLRTGGLRPHLPADNLTKIAPVKYDPKARCPHWLEFLAQVFEPHPDIPEFLQRAVGYSLTGDTREECLFLLWGAGRNGKGTLLKTISSLMGDYAGTADFSTFLAQKIEGGRPTDGIANMRSKRLIRSEESNEGARLAEGVLKTLTGGDRIRARRLHENSYEFEPTWKIWLATNHKPEIRGTDTAIWSRLRLIPFEVSFAGREDRTLKHRLMDELPGILSWAVEGALRWQEDGLQLPPAVVVATEQYRLENDQVGRFLDECCTAADCVRVRARELYLTYRKWVSDTGEHELTETMFGKRMAEKGFAKTHTMKGAAYLGIGLCSTHDGFGEE